MNAQELRVGNLVTSKTWKGAHRISGIREKIDSFVVHINGFDHEFKEGVYCDIEPITLTEEWLVRFGFYIDSDKAGTRYISLGRTNKAMELFLVIPNNTLILSVRIDMIFVDLGARIKHIHQLQNLYFALTGQELTYNPK